MAKAAAESWMYGDPEQHDLKTAIAAHHGVGIENIAVDSGIDALFGIIVRLIVAPGDTVVTSLGGYPTFIFHVDGIGGRLVRVPFKDDREDWPGLLAAAKAESARLLYFANPDNPMGTWWGARDVQRLIDGTPDGTLLVLDEAYSDTAPPDAIPPLDVSNPSRAALPHVLEGLRHGRRRASATASATRASSATSTRSATTSTSRA